MPIELHQDAESAATWSGTMTAVGLSFDVEVGTYEYSDGPAPVIQTSLGWFLPQTLHLEGEPPRLAWNKEAPPSRLDLEILDRAGELLSSEADWDRDDDRECGPSDTTYSLYCALAEATRQITGEYRHRQPALQAVRRMVEDEWPERLAGHRLMNFNNDARTTHGDLMRALELAKARVREAVR
jgi:hypothetical protein